MELVMQLFLVNLLWMFFSRVNVLWAASLITMSLILPNGRWGSRQNFVPMWPDFVRFLSRLCPNLGQICPYFAQFGERTFRMPSKCSGGKRMKITSDSGASESLVRCVPVHANPPRARARLGAAYDSGRSDQVQFVYGGKENRGAEVQQRFRILMQMGQVRRRKNASETESDGRIPPLREYVSPGRRSRSVSAHCFSCNSFRAGDHIYRYRHQVLRG
ncbi:hypothetical protein Pan153_18940 [Gimesia panareensis]|uniref:Uncharacterized protein n=1 Tax=Gimesia panareensis TaxID=2527978 RepID=A0A518FLR1_9PLAN|nr:hypothetical protein Pan153_18940 [Gimesia panareensis]